MNAAFRLIPPAIVPELDPHFRPPALANAAFREEVADCAGSCQVSLVLERADGVFARWDTEVFPVEHERAPANYVYLERMLKFLLWQKGAWRVYVAAPKCIADFLRYCYAASGPRAFDHEFMGENVYGRAFEVVACDYDELPAETVGGIGTISTDWSGWRVGFDLGASDRKVALMHNGELALGGDGHPLLSSEYPWHPRDQVNPRWHYEHILEILKIAQERLKAYDPSARIDAIGGSSAGIYVNNRVRVASLFRGITSNEVFERDVNPIFLKIQEAMGGVPLRLENDGDVTAIAGAMAVGCGGVLGIAMGSSLAAGYADEHCQIAGWLNELAFAPVDYNPMAPIDEWSGDAGLGVQYFSQQAVGRLIPDAGIVIDDIPIDDLPNRLCRVQELAAEGNESALSIYRTIGTYLGYTLAHYADFYKPLNCVEVLGRVTTGYGGKLILEKAREVLDHEFPELAQNLSFYEPSEREKRHGQAAAAAHLPQTE